MILLAFSTLLRTELTVVQFNTASPKVVSNSVANKTDKCICAESGSCYHPSSFAALLNWLWWLQQGKDPLVWTSTHAQTTWEILWQVVSLFLLHETLYWFDSWPPVILSHTHTHVHPQTLTCFIMHAFSSEQFTSLDYTLKYAHSPIITQMYTHSLHYTVCT